MYVPILSLGLLSIPLAAATAPGAVATVTPEPDFAIRAAVLELGNGAVIENGVVLIADGRIAEVGADVELPAGLPVIDHDGVLSPGLIACRTQCGAAEETVDGTREVLAEARLAEAFDPEHPDFRRALEAGITTAVLAPRATTLVPGRTAVVKTWGGTLLDRSAHLVISFSPDALNPGAEPSSYQGALVVLAQLFEAAEGAFGAAAAGELPVLFEAGGRAQVLRATRFATERGLRGALAGAALGGEIAETISKSGLGVILGPYGEGTRQRVLDSAGTLGEAGVPLAFGLDAPTEAPDRLRITAAMCLRGGLDRATALAGLTYNAAAIAGVEDRVGRLAKGLDADLVLWSGDPLDLASSVEAVYVDGQLAYRGGDR